MFFSLFANITIRFKYIKLYIGTLIMSFHKNTVL